MAINAQSSGGKGFGDRVKTSSKAQQPQAQGSVGAETQQAIEGSTVAAQETMQGITQMMGASVVHGVNQLAQQRETLVDQGSDALARLTNPQQLWADTVTRAAGKLNASGYAPLFIGPLATAVDWPQQQPSQPVSVAGLFPPSGPVEAKQLQQSSNDNQK